MNIPKRIYLDQSLREQYLSTSDAFVVGDYVAYELVLPGELGQALNVRVKKSNGEIVEDIGYFLNGYLRYTLNSSLYNQPGDITFDISIIGKHGERLTSITLHADVVKGVGTALVPDADVNILQTMITKSQETMNSTIASAVYADENGDYAKAQGDYAKAQGDYAEDEVKRIDPHISNNIVHITGEERSRWNNTSNPLYTSTSSGNNYYITPSPAISEYQNGMRFYVRFNASNSGFTPYLNAIDSTSTNNRRIYLFASGTTNPEAGMIQANSIWLVEYVGTHANGRFTLVGAPFTRVSDLIAAAGSDTAPKTWTPQMVAHAVRNVPLTASTSDPLSIPENPSAISRDVGVRVNLERLQGQVNQRAKSTDLSAHSSNSNIHVSTDERTKWNNLTSHLSDSIVHITDDERNKWNDTGMPSEIRELYYICTGTNDHTAINKIYSDFFTAEPQDDNKQLLLHIVGTLGLPTNQTKLFNFSLLNYSGSRRAVLDFEACTIPWTAINAGNSITFISAIDAPVEIRNMSASLYVKLPTPLIDYDDMSNSKTYGVAMLSATKNSSATNVTIRNCNFQMNVDSPEGEYSSGVINNCDIISGTGILAVDCHLYLNSKNCMANVIGGHNHSFDKCTVIANANPSNYSLTANVSEHSIFTNCKIASKDSSAIYKGKYINCEIMTLTGNSVRGNNTELIGCTFPLITNWFGSSYPISSSTSGCPINYIYTDSSFLIANCVFDERFTTKINFAYQDIDNKIQLNRSSHIYKALPGRTVNSGGVTY